MACLAFALQGSYIIGPTGGPIFPSSSTPSNGTSNPASTTASATSLSINMSPQPTVGSVIIVAMVTVTGTNDQTNGVVDNQTNGYSRLLMFQNDTASTNPRIALFCGVVRVSSGTFTITGSTIAAGSKWLAAKEYKNGTCNQDVPQVAAIGNTHPYSCGSLTTGNANDIVIAIVGQSFGGGGTNTATAPTGFTVIQTQTNGNVVATGSFAEKITSATGTFNGTYDLTNVLQPSVNNTSCGQVAVMSH